ncbi:hypothetical protein LTS18_006291, partial [Coniosporium uncinatum]
MSVTAGMKRAHRDEVNGYEQTKRQRIRHHALKHTQPAQADPLLAPQKEHFFQIQLMRSIAIALASAGFECAPYSVLEAFRAEAEEYMLHFLTIVKDSMLSSRRSIPTPQDFILALVQHNVSPTSLLPHISARIPDSIIQPPIYEAPPDDDPPPNLSNVIGSDLNATDERARRRYIPSHFPTLPSKHTWQVTPVLTKRETDARRIREQATQEGILAEQALRKLMASNKSSLSENAPMRLRGPSKKAQEDEAMWEMTMKAALREDEIFLKRWTEEQERKRQEEEEQEMQLDWGLDGAGEAKPVHKIKQEVVENEVQRHEIEKGMI